MPETKRPLKVFLCHARADREPVHALYVRLKREGVDVWLDKEKLLPGADWEYEIRKAVRESDVVVVCLSKQFNQAGFRQKEVRLALDTAMEKPEGEIFIIPARLEECDTLESLRKWHWVDLFEPNGYEIFMRAVQACANKNNVAINEKKRQVHDLPPFQQFKKTPFKKIVGSLAVFVILSGLTSTLGTTIFQRIILRTTPLPTDFFVTPVIPITKTPTIAMVPKEIVVPTITTTPAHTAIPTNTLTPSATDFPFEIIDAYDVPMRLIPAGEFMMGSLSGEEDEQPVHIVYLDAFYIDKYEVTNALYKTCVDVGICNPPHEINSYSHKEYFGNPEFDNYPVIYVDWYQAQSYCEWREGKLPTEAQWEKSMRGNDGRNNPWGDGVDCDKANYGFCVGDTTPVGSYKNGRSPYGIYDLAGNVWEWVADWYSDTYYKQSPLSNPLGPDSGNPRIRRGSSWGTYSLRSVNRVMTDPNLFNYNIGFRCARSLP